MPASRPRNALTRVLVDHAIVRLELELAVGTLRVDQWAAPHPLPQDPALAAAASEALGADAADTTNPAAEPGVESDDAQGAMAAPADDVPSTTNDVPSEN